ncbi:INO80 complex subunit C-like [Anneissia japonica]|uniref:INO80 complex subunit C-like n=1 Tax=Anneissia japonica TaxID=1529436 RepID=UPI00142592F0|nr:INO80 complex subunit C-like [Anneissia japonica]
MSVPSRPNTRSRRNVQQTKQEVKVTPSPSAPKRRRGGSTSTTPTKTTNTVVTSISPAPKEVLPQATVIEKSTKSAEQFEIEVKSSCSEQTNNTTVSLPRLVDPKLSFKDPNYLYDKTAGRRKSKGWKSLRQIAAAERALPGRQGQSTYGSIDAPPSFKPSKKYSDISGLEAKYTDPQTKLRYTNAEEYSRISLLPMDIVNGLLSLRKANSIVP